MNLPQRGKTNPYWDPFSHTVELDSNWLPLQLKLPSHDERVAVMMYLHRNLEDPNHGRRTGTEKVSSGWGEGEFDNPCFIGCVYKAYPNHRFYRSLRRLGRGLSQRLKGTIPLSKELSILVMYSKVCISFSAKQHFKCEIPLHRHLPFSPSTLPVKIYLKLNAKNQDPFYSLINHPRIM